MRFLLFGLCCFLFSSAVLCNSVASERLSSASKSASNSQAAASNNNFQTKSAAYTWILSPDSNFMNNIMPPNTQSNGWAADGWVYYGSQNSQAACQSRCDADANCWAYTWYDASQSTYALLCYGRQPWTNSFFPGSIQGQLGCWSGYKEITSFGNSFNQLYIGSNTIWAPSVTKVAAPGINYFSGAFNPTQQYNHQNSGYFMLNGIVVSNTPSAQTLVAGQSGAINIGAVVDEDMCSAALDFLMYLSLNNGNPSILANYYSFMSPAAGAYARECFIGNAPMSYAQEANANSAARVGPFPTLNLI